MCKPGQVDFRNFGYDLLDEKEWYSFEAAFKAPLATLFSPIRHPVLIVRIISLPYCHGNFETAYFSKIFEIFAGLRMVEASEWLNMKTN